MMRLFLLFVLFSYIKATAQTSYPMVYKTSSFDGVLFGKSDNLFVKHDAANPSIADIDKAESILRSKIDSIVVAFNIESKIPIAINQKFRQYKRQYFAYLNHKGEKVVIISFFHFSSKPGDEQWKKQPILVDDGWDDFWRISYNLKTEQLSDFSVNSLGG